ncbi:MAG: glycosyltransferase [Planctomycetes bacterium]|nr:glycosyltransferase [Planctomycetota bacterium]
MKVLYATMQFGRGYGQGTERYLAILGRGLQARGHELVYLAGDPERRGPRLALGEVVTDEPRVLAYPTYGRMAVQGVPTAELETLLRHLRPDIVHLTNAGHIGAGIIPAAGALGIPVAVTVMDYWWLCPKHTLQHHRGGICDGQVSWRECVTCVAAGHPRRALRFLARTPALRAAALPTLTFLRAMMRGLPAREVGHWKRRRAFLRAALHAVQAVIFASSTGRDLLGLPADGPRSYQIPYGLEPHWFNRGTAPRTSAGADGTAASARNRRDVTLGYAGALAEHKGVHLLLEALHHLGWSSTRVRIAGGGDDAAYAARLRALARGLSVDFCGRVHSEDMPEFLAGLDVLVVPSLWPENLPIIVLEAQAVGVPVLASRVGGIAEMLPSAQHLFDLNSASSLADRLAAWRAGELPPTVANVSTADEMVARTLRVYEQVDARPNAHFSRGL